MTYATYVNDVSAAQQLGLVPGYTSDARQVPLQLASMLLFNPSAPLADLDTIVGTTDNERVFIRLYREILRRNP